MHLPRERRQTLVVLGALAAVVLLLGRRGGGGRSWTSAQIMSTGAYDVTLGVPIQSPLALTTVNRDDGWAYAGATPTGAGSGVYSAFNTI